MNSPQIATRLECIWLVARMAYWMLRQLWKPANLKKGHWRQDTYRYLRLRLYEESMELDKAPTWPEAADVANFAAMIADLKF